MVEEIQFRKPCSNAVELIALGLLSAASFNSQGTLVARSVGSIGTLVVLDIAGSSECVGEVLECGVACDLELTVSEGSHSRGLNSTKGTREGLEVVTTGSVVTCSNTGGGSGGLGCRVSKALLSRRQEDIPR